MHIMDKKNIKKGYNPPIVKTVSFMVEQGFAGSTKYIGDASTTPDPTFGTQKLENQSDWNVTWRTNNSQTE